MSKPLASWKPRVSRRALLGAALGAPLLAPALSGCGSAEASPNRLRLGYFANITHGVALAGVARGTFTQHMDGSRIESQIFSSGPAAVQAMLAGALDIAYLGPNPALTAWVRTKGKGVRVIAGAAQNGAALVARPGIASVEDLRGRTVAAPQIGGTQDVALKTLLRRKGIPIGSGADAVELVWMAGSQTLDQFKSGRLDAAYQAEPWVSRLVVEGGAKVLVDETHSWPTHRFATTTVLVSQTYADRYPHRVEQFLGAHVASTQWLRSTPDAASLLNAEIGRLAGKKLRPAVIERAMKSVVFSWDPMMANIADVARHTWETGGIDVEPHLAGMADVGPLNTVLRRSGEKPVSAGGYGRGEAA